MSRRLSEEYCEMSEEIKNKKEEDTKEDIKDDAKEDIKENTNEETSESTQEDISEETSESTQEETSEETSESTQEETNEEKVFVSEEFEKKIEKAMEQITSNKEEVPPVQKQSAPAVQTPKKNHKVVKIVGTLVGTIILCGIGGYAGMSYYYSNKFFPGTTINSFDCSDLTVAQAEELIRNKVEDYSLTVASKDHEEETISAESIDYKYKSDGAVKKAFEEQKPYEWIKGCFVKTKLSVGENITYDKEKVKTELEKLECMKPENQVPPKDAYITFEDTLFTIIPGEEGSTINEDKALELLYTAIDHTEKEVNLEKGGAYVEPNVREDDEGLQERLKIVNTYAKASVTHTYGDTTETLDSKTFKDWYSKDANGDLYLDGEVLKTKLREYVANMAYNHDTLGATRTFHTTSGRTIEVGGGNYGWQIDQYSEVEKMYNEILTGQQVTREPVYASTANAWVNGSDIGNTYIEVDLSEQHLYFYRDGNNIFESDFVSGNMSYDDRKTPTGVCHIVYKTKNFTLRGDKKPDGTYSYEEPVEYWMPFNGGVGFHDAPWRSEFGGDIYLTSGSHGCINMPESSAAQLYDLIDESIPIVAFY